LKEYKFTDGKEINETVEELGYKKAVRQFQGSHKDLKEITVTWTTKRGKEMIDVQPLPMNTRNR
jgi:maltoporin